MPLRAFCPFISYFKILLNYSPDFYTYSLLKENILISLKLHCTAVYFSCFFSLQQ